MNDAELKPILRGILDSLAAVTEKQAIELELLVAHLPGLTDEDRGQIAATSKASYQRATELREHARRLQ